MTVQTDYSQDMNQAMAGLRKNSGFGNVVSAAAEEVIPFGVVAAEHTTDPEICRLPSPGTVVVTEDAGAHTSGGLSALVNGVAVSVAYDTDKATTWGNLATAIAALGFITSCAYAAPALTTVSDPNIGLFMSVDASAAVGGVTISSTVGSLADTIKGLVVKSAREYGSERAFENDRVLLTLSGDTITTSDTIDGNINGVALATVTYATSEAVTLQLVANAILNVPGVASAVVSGRTILVSNNPGLVMERASLTVTDDTLASVAPTFAATYSKQDIGLVNTDVANLPGETVGCERRGVVWLVAEEAIVKTDSVFVRISAGTGTQRGAVRTDIDSGTAVAVTALRFAGPSVTASDGVTLIVPVEINLP